MTEPEGVRMFRGFLWCVVCTWLCAVSTGSAQTTITFAQALGRAKSDAPSVRVATAALATARASEQRARGAYLPRFSAEGTGTIGYSDFPVTPTDSVDSTALTASGSASAEWTLLDFGTRGSAVNAAHATAEASAANADASRRLALELAAEAYLRALSARELVQNANLTFTRRSDEARSIAELVAAGVRPGVDRQRADIEVIAARFALEMNNVAEHAALAALAVTVGADPTSPVSPADPPGAALGDGLSVQDAVAIAVVERPEMKRAEAAIRARGGDAEGARAQRWPTLGALLDGTLAHTEVINGLGIDGPTYLASAGLVMRWNGLDATVWRQAKVADAALTEATKARDEVLLSVRAEAVAAAFAVQQQRAGLEQAEQLLSAARVMREAQVERYRAGVASLLELLDAEGIEQTSRVRRIEAGRDYDLARMRLLSACGVLTKRFAR